VFGEVVDAMYQARKAGLGPVREGWEVGRALVHRLEEIWREPDEGIWEMRANRQHFVHSKVMAWVALDRAIRSVEEFGVEGPVDRWRRLRDEVHREVCERGFDASLGSFVQAYGSKHLDASLLHLALVGFLPPEDPRIRGTVAAIERHLDARRARAALRHRGGARRPAPRRGARSSPAASGSPTTS
jgi:GH15 family glucan-1,4-alpha-glucosidase